MHISGRTSGHRLSRFYSLLTQTALFGIVMFALAGCQSMNDIKQGFGIGNDDADQVAASLGPKRLPALNAGDRTTGGIMIEKGEVPASRAVSDMGAASMGTIPIPDQSPVMYQAPQESMSSAPASSLQEQAATAIVSAPVNTPAKSEKAGFWSKTKNLFGMGEDEAPNSRASTSAQVAAAPSQLGSDGYPLLNQTPDNPPITPVEMRHQAMDELQLQYAQNENLRQDFVRRGEEVFTGGGNSALPVGSKVSALNYAMPADGELPKVAPIQPAPATPNAVSGAVDFTPPALPSVASTPVSQELPKPTNTGYQPPVARITNNSSATPLDIPANLPDMTKWQAPTASSPAVNTPIVNGQPSVLPPPPSVAAPRPIDLATPPVLQRNIATGSDVVSSAPSVASGGLVSQDIPPASPVASVPAPTNHGLPAPSSFDEELPPGTRLLAPSRYADRVK